MQGTFTFEGKTYAVDLGEGFDPPCEVLLPDGKVVLLAWSESLPPKGEVTAFQHSRHHVAKIVG